MAAVIRRRRGRGRGRRKRTRPLSEWQRLFGRAARECHAETGFGGCMRRKIAELRGAVPPAPG